MIRALSIAKKEILQLKRDRMTIGMMVMMPMMQILLFGYAINTDVRHSPTVIYDQDRSRASRDLARGLEVTGFYDIVGQVSSYAEIERAMRSGRARVALVVPAEYGSKLSAGEPAQVQLVVDGSDPQTVASATNTAASLVAARSAQLLVSRLVKTGAAVREEPIRLEANTWYNPDLRTAVYIVPGLVGQILTMTLMMFTAMGIVRERERGTLEQLIVSPVKNHELIIGKILPYIAAGYVQMTLVFVVGQLVFDVPFAGSLPLMYGLAFLFIGAMLAMGLFFSTVAKTQQQAMQMSFFFFLPSMLLSGFMFPFEGMPKPAQYIGQFVPLTHFLRIVRGVALRGAGFADLEGEIVWLAGIMLGLIMISSLRFRKKLV
jgi:ABC-2 type transport system permease protein